MSNLDRAIHYFDKVLDSDIDVRSYTDPLLSHGIIDVKRNQKALAEGLKILCEYLGETND